MSFKIFFFASGANKYLNRQNRFMFSVAELFPGLTDVDVQTIFNMEVLLVFLMTQTALDTYCMMVSPNILRRLE